MRHLGGVVHGIVLPSAHGSHFVAEVALHHEVILGGATFRHNIVRHIRHSEKNGANFIFGSLETLVDLLVIFLQCSHLSFNSLGFVFLALLHESAYLGSHLIELGGLVVALGLSCAALLVEFDDAAYRLLGIEVLFSQLCDYFFGVGIDCL